METMDYRIFIQVLNEADRIMVEYFRLVHSDSIPSAIYKCLSEWGVDPESSRLSLIVENHPNPNIVIQIPDKSVLT
jgi:hypothetical protein